MSTTLAATAPCRSRGIPRSDRAKRTRAQSSRVHSPELPTTTIGSFPQTTEVRRARADHRAGRIDDAAYDAAMKAEIARVVELQEDLGLDIIEAALANVPAERLWINPDCGLKTRGYAEVKDALGNLVAARNAVLDRDSAFATTSVPV